MEYLLIIIILASVFGSFLCSLSEAALYSVPLSHIRKLAESGSPAGQALLRFKDDMGPPIAAILIVNTIANTAGPSLAGALITDLYGEKGVVVFAIFITFTVLYFSEILPKIIGVSYARQVSQVMALPISGLITILWPLISFSQFFSRRIRAKSEGNSVSHEEVLTMAALGREEGTLDHLEGAVIENVIGLDRVLVRDILTPRVMVFRVDESMTLEQVRDVVLGWHHTRVPLTKAGDEDHLNAYVRQRDVYREIIRGNLHLTLMQVARRLPVVPELMRADQLLLQMIRQKDHICSVVDEHGALAGIVTLEDIIEEIVGHEITDEYDLEQKKGGRLVKQPL